MAMVAMKLQGAFFACGRLSIEVNWRPPAVVDVLLLSCGQQVLFDRIAKAFVNLS